MQQVFKRAYRAAVTRSPDRQGRKNVKEEEKLYRKERQGREDNNNKNNSSKRPAGKQDCFGTFSRVVLKFRSSRVFLGDLCVLGGEAVAFFASLASFAVRL
jgi:hypothetical protein